MHRVLPLYSMTYIYFCLTIDNYSTKIKAKTYYLYEKYKNPYKLAKYKFPPE